MEPASWECDSCTFVNSGYLSSCEVCEAERRQLKLPRHEVPRHAEVIDLEALDDELGAPVDAGSEDTFQLHGDEASPEPESEPDEAQQEDDRSSSADDELCRPFDVDDAPTHAPTTRHAPLSPCELAAFARDGYLVVRGVVPPHECARLLWERVAPALLEAGIDPFDRSTWASGAAGAALKAPDGGDHPIPLACADARWPALFSSGGVLCTILDQLHGGAWGWTPSSSPGPSHGPSSSLGPSPGPSASASPSHSPNQVRPRGAGRTAQRRGSDGSTCASPWRRPTAGPHRWTDGTSTAAAPHSPRALPW